MNLKDEYVKIINLREEEDRKHLSASDSENVNDYNNKNNKDNNKRTH